MKKFVLAAMAAAAAASFSGSALAVDLTLPTPVPDNFASELVTAGTTAVKTTTVITDLGFGVSPTQTRFIRYDFTNSKIGAGGIVAANLVIPGVAAADVVLSSGGAAGGTNVIFQITAGAAGVAQNAPVTLTLANGLVPTVLGPIDATYRLYETAAAAVAGAGQLAGDAGNIIGFSSGVALGATQNTNTVAVASSPTYTNFFVAPVAPPPLPTSVLAEIGKISLGTNAAKDPNGVLVTLPQILGAGTAITLTGTDLAAADAAGLFLSTVANCGAAAIAGTSRTATSVSFVLPAPVAPIVSASLCFQVPAANTTPIAAQTFTADVAPGAVPGVPLPDVPAVTAGTFIRNGLTLKAAFAETTTASGISSAAHLTNTTGNAIPFTVNCVLNTGSVAGTPGTLPARTAQRFALSANGLGCPSNGTLRGVEIFFATTDGSVIGSIVRQNTTTGQASFDGMVGNSK